MKKLLLTGFEPFLQFTTNPTMEIVQSLNGTIINGYNIIGRIMSVDFTRSGKEMLNYYEETQPDAVISLGLAGGRTKITPERIAINCNDGDRDNSGNKPAGEKIIPDGPDGLFSTLPIQKMVESLKEQGYPAGISNTAGTYLCNHVMYQMLYTLNQDHHQIQSGFIHIPASHELAIDAGKMPSWSQEDLLQSIRICIEALD
ncbi:pyroglutamyl-peptidase I [Jeotgalibacillus sp. S-D1]|uniref:pyroglutamyl-peptidase I n=1 Tax=Jeotgalibacillus sp. S-D1 TaxID=2552189 RepID=UPI00105A36B2|nr:pyroglutamyl-peptidase I [Jeotgalibacillus sp. S-D1]TDL30458.1 pyroglutamyl-peptidase I [Jeotgalibacillus sp. S-D1]